MKSPARLVVGVALSLLLCSLLQCAAGQGAEAEEMMRLPINFGDGNAPQTLEVAAEPFAGVLLAPAPGRRPLGELLRDRDWARA